VRIPPTAAARVESHSRRTLHLRHDVGTLGLLFVPPETGAAAVSTHGRLQLEDAINALKRQRDEIPLRLHLAEMEARNATVTDAAAPGEHATRIVTTNDAAGSPGNFCSPNRSNTRRFA
jgi:hypothetical protein